MLDGKSQDYGKRLEDGDADEDGVDFVSPGYFAAHIMVSGTLPFDIF